MFSRQVQNAFLYMRVADVSHLILKFYSEEYIIITTK